MELRCPDPAANPYLVLAACLEAGLDGIRNQITPPDAVTENVFEMRLSQKAKLGIESLPGDLEQAVEELEMREQTASEKLEHAFDFIEAAFADGQELVVFVTELAMDPEAAVFLAENENERFRKYNEQLLLGTKKAELLSELREGTIHSQENVCDF